MDADNIIYVVTDLCLLGDSTSEVYESLLKKGIKGKRNNSCQCPLARYLSGLGYVGVDIGKSLRIGSYYAGLPIACASFISAFDAGKFPQLEECCTL